MNKIEQIIRENVSELKTLNSNKLEKYSRNLRYYTNSPHLTIENMKNPMIVGYYNINEDGEDDTSDPPSINVCKSTIDTLTSKMSQSKVRPFFNCMNGTFKDIQICRESQLFFDQYFDQQEVNKKVSLAFKDACIFERGCIYVDDINSKITRALPWQVYVRPAEATYNHITRVYYEQADFPVSNLPENLRSKIKRNVQYVTYGIYYDTVEHIRAQYVTDIGEMIIDPYEGENIPFIFLYYTNPTYGISSVSVVDMLKTIQQEINIIMSKIKDASQINNPLTYFVPDGSNIKVQQLDNRAGNVVQYRVTPDMPANPITVATHPFIDDQYIQWIDNLVAKAYELVGVSQLSSQSKKPGGINSGVGLQTLQDVESERFQTQLDQVIKCYVDIAKTCLKVFPKDSSILPKSQYHVNITWGEVVEEEKKMSIQFSAADSLSKDPSTKLAQLQQLAQSGIIPQSRIAQFMQLPDLESGYSLSNNAINAVLTVIDDCINHNNFEIPEYVPIQMLKEEIVNTQLSLRSANYQENINDINKLTKLYQKCEELDISMNEAANEEIAEAEQEQQTALAEMPQPEVDLDMQTQDQGNGGWQ